VSLLYVIPTWMHSYYADNEIEIVRGKEEGGGGGAQRG
jgi:hypothetical protein